MGIHPRQSSNLLLLNPNLLFKPSILQFRLAIIKFKHQFGNSNIQLGNSNIQFGNSIIQFVSSNIQFGHSAISAFVGSGYEKVSQACLGLFGEKGANSLASLVNLSSGIKVRKFYVLFFILILNNDLKISDVSLICVIL